MRTTLQIDDDVLEFARSVASSRQVSLGEVISDLARSGMKTKVGVRRDPISELWVFDTASDAPVLTSKAVEHALAQEFQEEYKKCRPHK